MAKPQIWVTPKRLSGLNWHLKEQALFLGMFCSLGIALHGIIFL
jgi:hypothetical protein